MTTTIANVSYPYILGGDDEESQKLYADILLGDLRLFAEWTGGIYIELGMIGHGPVEVINVYDYAQGVIEIDSERGTFQRKLEEWIADYGPDDLYRDASENWIYY